MSRCALKCGKPLTADNAMKYGAAEVHGTCALIFSLLLRRQRILHLAWATHGRPGAPTPAATAPKGGR